MNVMEDALRERIDPHLTPQNLSVLASRALRREVSVAHTEVLTGGCWNRVVGVRLLEEEPELVMKISAHRQAPGIEREHAVLEYFARHTRMPVPEPYLLDSSCRTIPGTLLVMARIPGRVMHSVMGALSPPEREQLMDKIGGYVADLHETRSTGFGGVELAEEARHASWPEFWMPRFRAVLEDTRKQSVVDRAFLAEVERASRDFDSALDIGPASTLTHYDIWSGNVMLDLDHGKPRVSGFIDIPGNWADYARELSFMEMLGLADEGLYATYRGRHLVDEGFELRKNIYNLKMHLKHVCMYPDESYYRRGAAACLHTIAALI